ncbi:MAG: hypothetical protein HYV28_08300 [Ignavibacteriales bacterium]|nr:hypothetical protein [Ignavibacteriales bacterium]
MKYINKPVNILSATRIVFLFLFFIGCSQPYRVYRLSGEQVHELFVKSENNDIKIKISAGYFTVSHEYFSGISLTIYNNSCDTIMVDTNDILISFRHSQIKSIKVEPTKLIIYPQKSSVMRISVFADLNATNNDAKGQLPNDEALRFIVESTVLPLKKMKIIDLEFSP